MHSQINPIKRLRAIKKITNLKSSVTIQLLSLLKRERFNRVKQGMHIPNGENIEANYMKRIKD